MKMKLAILSLLCGAFVSTSAAPRAKEFVVLRNGVSSRPKVETHFGVMGGVAMVSLNDLNASLDIESRTGVQLGAMWGVDFGRVELVPQLIYQHTKAGVSSPALGIEGRVVSSSLEMPIVASLECGPLNINAGPTLALMVNTSLESDSGEVIEMGRTRPTAGYLVGVSTLLNDHLLLDLRMVGGFNTVAGEIDYVEEHARYRSKYNSISLNIGYRF